MVIDAFTATVYIKMKKPNAAIRDANAALEVTSTLIVRSICNRVFMSNGKFSSCAYCALHNIK